MKRRTIFVLLVVLVPLIAWQCAREATVPDELIGVWKTSDPKYANKPFEIRKDVLVFTYGGGGSDFGVFNIVAVEKPDKGGRTLYVITYAIPEGLEYKFSFYYTSEQGGIINYKNQPKMEWRRVSGPT